MTIKNLSVVFTPALFHDHNQAENNGEWYSDKVLEDLIRYHKTLFSDIEKQKQAENASTSPIPSQHNTRNTVNRNSMQSFQSINTSSSTNSGSGPFTYLSRRISTSLKKSNKTPTEDNMSDISTSLSIPEQEVPRSS
jgi:hypothetical protein